MSIGSRIAQARQEAGMSQRELAGDTVTRNMLSLLEHDQANPSLDTLRRLAARLGKPVSFFLGEDVPQLPGLEQLLEARGAFETGEYGRVLELLEQVPAGEILDPQRKMLRMEAALAAAEQALAEGKTRYARILLERCGPWLGECPWEQSSLSARRSVLLARCAGTAAELQQCENTLPDVDEILCLQAQCALAAERPGDAVRVLDAARDRESPRWKLLRGDAAFQCGDWENAVACYHGAEKTYPKEVRKGLQLSYAKLGNFEKAYAYAVME